MIRDEEQEKSVIKKGNDLISFKFGDVQTLRIMKFLLRTHFSEPIKQAKLNNCFPMSSLESHTNLIFPNCHLMKPFSVNFETTNLLTETSLSMRSWEKVGLTYNKHRNSFKSSLCFHLAWIITITYEWLERKTERLSSKTFVAVQY